LYKLKIDKSGISQIYGIQLKNGKMYGWIFKYNWQKIIIKVWSWWPNPSISIDKSNIPKIWWVFHSNYNKCMEAISFYGKDRMIDEITLNYFRKYSLFENSKN
jgi:hypothetical protein